MRQLSATVTAEAAQVMAAEAGDDEQMCPIPTCAYFAGGTVTRKLYYRYVDLCSGGQVFR